MARYATLKDEDGVIYPQLGPTAVTHDNLDTDLQVKELVYEYSQGTTSSSDVLIDIPIDFGKYEAYYFDMVGVGSSSTKAWGGVSALGESKSLLSTEQYGIEQNDSASLVGLARSGSEVISCGWQNNQLSYIEFTFRAVNANDYPWPCFKAFGQGAGRNQIIQGSVKESSATVKYIRFTLRAPTGNGFTKVHAYATRRRS